MKTENPNNHVYLPVDREDLDVFFNHTHDLYQKINPEGKILNTNKAWHEKLGYNQEDVKQLSFKDLIHPDSHDVFLNHWPFTKDSENPQVMELILKGKSCQKIQVSAKIIIKTKNDHLDSVHCLFEDKTILKNAIGELEQFAYVTSHDLQEPLRMITSYLQLLARRYKGKLDETADEFINFAVDGGERMTQMIKDLLGYSRINTRGNPFMPVDCNDLMATLLKHLQFHIQDHQVKIEYDSLPDVLADQSQLEQLFFQLLMNAIEFRSNKPPHIMIQITSMGPFWQFSVKDNGIGIPEGEHERIFVIFQKLHKKEDHPGSGMGLALCQRIVRRHGGDITVESEPGKGSTFIFTLPANVA